jgi:NADH-quinone oxidoreductase subunit E
MPDIDLSLVGGIIKEHSGQPGAVIAILQAIQEEYRYLPREIFPLLSSALKISEAKIFSVATFYENFSLEPKGRTIIKVCDGTACHVRRSMPILSRIRQDLGLRDGRGTTDDLEFTVETVSCLGACGLSPVLTVNDKAYPGMTPDKATSLLASIRSNGKERASLALAAERVIEEALSLERSLEGSSLERGEGQSLAGAQACGENQASMEEGGDNA